jgi:hypothetical protein
VLRAWGGFYSNRIKLELEKKGRNGVAVPLLDAAQIDAQRRGGGREMADQGGRKVGRGGKGGGRWQRGESEAAR